MLLVSPDPFAPYYVEISVFPQDPESILPAQEWALPETQFGAIIRKMPRNAWVIRSRAKMMSDEPSPKHGKEENDERA